MEQVSKPQFEIIYKDNISTHNKEIVDLYWKIENDKFVHDTNSLASKFNLTRNRLYTIATSNSSIKQYKTCCICQNEYGFSHKKRSDVFRISENNYCLPCILRSGEEPRSIDECSSNSSIQKTEDKKEKKNNFQQLDHTNILKFILSKGAKNNNSSPEYSGTFMLKQDIVLKKSVKYLYGGWKLPDGSINLSFIPTILIQPPAEQTTLDQEPEEWLTFLNNLNS